LGTAAGGGFPQWNCNCILCREVRQGKPGLKTLSQSSATVSADGKSWFLLNASPDIRHQIEAFHPLLPSPELIRGTSIEGVLLTNADLDHVLGIFILREGSVLPLHAPAAVRKALDEGLRISEVLKSYGGLSWHEPPSDLKPLLKSDGSESGLLYEAFEVSGKLPRYAGSTALKGSAVGYRFVDPATQGRLVFLPDTAALSGEVLEKLKDCDTLLLDGTFWDDEEMTKTGTGMLTASRMAHLPVGGPQGSLEIIRNLPIKRKIYMHINNTNPILSESTPQYQKVKAAGVEVGVDGMEFEI
jgi:pyrroloquinoline quinone biosynthesis protein B